MSKTRVIVKFGMDSYAFEDEKTAFELFKTLKNCKPLQERYSVGFHYVESVTKSFPKIEYGEVLTIEEFEEVEAKNDAERKAAEEAKKLETAEEIESTEVVEN